MEFKPRDIARFRNRHRIGSVGGSDGVLVVGEEVDEPADLSARIVTVVAALATLTFALVRQKILDDCIDTHHATLLRCAGWLDCRFRAE